MIVVFRPVLLPPAGWGPGRQRSCWTAIRGRRVWAAAAMRGAVCSTGEGKPSFRSVVPTCFYCFGETLEQTSNTYWRHVCLQLQNEIILCEPDICENHQEQVRRLKVFIFCIHPCISRKIRHFCTFSRSFAALTHLSQIIRLTDYYLCILKVGHFPLFIYFSHTAHHAKLFQIFLNEGCIKIN